MQMAGARAFGDLMPGSTDPRIVTVLEGLPTPRTVRVGEAGRKHLPPGTGNAGAARVRAELRALEIAATDRQNPEAAYRLASHAAATRRAGASEGAGMSSSDVARHMRDLVETNQLHALIARSNERAGQSSDESILRSMSAM